MHLLSLIPRPFKSLRLPCYIYLLINELNLLLGPPEQLVLLNVLTTEVPHKRLRVEVAVEVVKFSDLRVHVPFVHVQKVHQFIIADFLTFTCKILF